MREIQKKQRFLGQVNIAEIQFHSKCRDDIPQLLKGIQFLYVNENTRTALFRALEKMISSKVDKNNGRPGMELWKIFVMGVLRLNLNWDYDRLQEMVNNHKTIREMLGHSWEDDNTQYELQTIKDNLACITEETLEEINQIVVNAGHKILKKKKAKY